MHVLSQLGYLGLKPPPQGVRGLRLEVLIGGYQTPGQPAAPVQVVRQRPVIEAEALKVTEGIKAEDVDGGIEQQGPVGVAAAVNPQGDRAGRGPPGLFQGLGQDPGHLFFGDGQVSGAESSQKGFIEKDDGLLA